MSDPLINAEVKMVGDIFTPGKADSEAGRVIGMQLTGAMKSLEGIMTEASPVGQFTNLKNSWVSEYDSQTLTAVVANNAEYALPVEKGAVYTDKMPPIEPIQLWVQSRLGITDEKESRGVAFAIAKKAKKVGIPTNPAKYDNRGFVQRNFDANADLINETFFQVIGSELVKALS